MKTIFFRLLLVIAAFVGLVFVVGTFLPRNYALESVVEIDAPVDAVFPQINELENWSNWSPWGEQEGIDVEFKGESAGVGSILTWSDPRGDGKLWITESQPNQLVKYRMYSGGFPEMESNRAKP